jgi:hypothetical protein
MRSLFKVERKERLNGTSIREVAHMVCFQCVIQLTEGEAVAAVPEGKVIIYKLILKNR